MLVASSPLPSPALSSPCLSGLESARSLWHGSQCTLHYWGDTLSLRDVWLPRTSQFSGSNSPGSSLHPKSPRISPTSSPSPMGDTHAKAQEAPVREAARSRTTRPQSLIPPLSQAFHSQKSLVRTLTPKIFPPLPAGSSSHPFTSSHSSPGYPLAPSCVFPTLH